MSEETLSKKKIINPAQAGLIAAGVAVMSVTAFFEHTMGRKIWGTGGQAGLWSNDINSETNSQFIADVYTFSHFLHGVLFYALFWLVARHLPVKVRLLAAIIVECGWELLENSDFIINRYRVQTISLNYFGDSIVNSMFDVIAMALGFWVAFRLPWKVTFALLIVIELGTLLWVRDNLTLNIIMLVHPVEAIKTWQGQI